jgi:uncharacterized membrane protein
MASSDRNGRLAGVGGFGAGRRLPDFVGSAFIRGSDFMPSRLHYDGAGQPASHQTTSTAINRFADMNMKKQPNRIKTTILGGLIFLIPFGLIIAVAGKVYMVMRSIALPITNAIGIDHIGAVAFIDLVTLFVTLGICYLAGLVATSDRGRRLYRSFDEKLLNIFPRYGFIKSLTHSLGGDETQAAMKPVLVHFDDQSQIAFEVDRDEQWVVLYLPGSPDPWSGTVSFCTPERVQPLAAEFSSTVRCLKVAGRGSLPLLQTKASGN